MVAVVTSSSLAFVISVASAVYAPAHPQVEVSIGDDADKLKTAGRQPGSCIDSESEIAPCAFSVSHDSITSKSLSDRITTPIFSGADIDAAVDLKK